MIDVRELQKDFKNMANALKRKGVDQETLDNLNAISENAKAKRQEMENVTAEQKILSKEFGRYKKEGLDIAPLQANINELKSNKQTLEDEVRSVLDEALFYQYDSNSPNKTDGF